MVLFFLSFFTAILIWALTLIGLVNPQKFEKHMNGKRLTRLQILLFGFVGTIISLVLIVLTAPDPSHKADAQVAQVKVDNSTDIKEVSQPVEKQFSLIDQVKSYDPKAIIAVEKQGDNVLDIHLKSSALGLSDGGYLDSAGRNAKDILIKLIKNNANEKFKIIRFVVHADLKDQYNKSFESAIFQIEYDFDEIKKMQIGDGYIDYKMFLNFTQFQVRHPVGHSVLEGWCQDGDNQVKSGAFCSSH